MKTENPYRSNTDYGKREPTSTPFWRWLTILLAVLLLLFVGFLIRGCTGPVDTVEVTRIVLEPGAEQPVTRIVEEQVEVTRLVPEVVVTKIPVTRIITETAEVDVEVEVEVTRLVPEFIVTEVPVTRVVREVEQFEVTRIVSVPPEITVTPGNGRGCTRFDLEIGRNQVDGTPEDGIYIMQEPSGHRLATWTAKQGWLDSGWLHNLPLSRSEVQVQVFFYPAAGDGPTPLEILNPAPDSANGWLANDICHAIEIQFPE